MNLSNVTEREPLATEGTSAMRRQEVETSGMGSLNAIALDRRSTTMSLLFAKDMAARDGMWRLGPGVALEADVARRVWTHHKHDD